MRTIQHTACAVLCVAVCGALPEALDAHEIPTDVTVRAFVKPEAEGLTLLVRVPLAAMRDMQVPTDAQGLLDLSRAGPVLEDAAILWIADYVEIYEEGRRLEAPRLVAARVSLPTDRSFDEFSQALEHIRGPPLPVDTPIYWAQGLLDVHFRYAIASPSSRFRINPGLERLGLRVVNILNFMSADGVVHTFNFPGNPGLISLEPSFFEVSGRFIDLGFRHILSGLDHLLFLFCLVIPFRQFRSLLVLVTSFTVAHSVTLVASALGFAPDSLWFPPLVETLIAVSILYMAFENIIGARLERRWLITFGFGLVHGFGFAFLLRDTLQFAGNHLLTSLLAFNVGVELGQIAVLLVMLPLLGLFFRHVVAERIGTIYLSALVTHSAWHWMTERFEQLRLFGWPTLDAELLLFLLRLAMIGVVFVAFVWVSSLWRRPPATSGEES